MPLTELIYLIEQSMAQYLASSTYATQTYTLNQLLNELNTNGVSIEFQNILFDTFPGLKWAQPIIQFTGALTRAAWLTIIHDVEEDIYEVEEVATYAEVPASAVAGGVGAAFGLSFTDAAEESWERVYRRLQIEADTPIPAAIVNEGTEEEPDYKVFLQQAMIEAYRKAMWAEGFFNEGGFSYDVRDTAGPATLLLALPVTIENTIKLIDPCIKDVTNQVGWTAGSIDAFRNNATIRSAYENHTWNMIAIKWANHATSYEDFDIYLINKPIPVNVVILNKITISDVSCNALDNYQFTDLNGYYRLRVRFNPNGTINIMEDQYLPAATSLSYYGMVVGYKHYAGYNYTGAKNEWITSSLGVTSAPLIEGLIRQDGAVIPATEEIDYDVLYPGWESVEVGQLEEDGTIVKYPIYPVSVELEDGLIIDVPQAIAQTGAIDIPDVKEWAESIAKPLVTEKVDYFTRTIAKAIPLAVSIPAGDTPPILIPTDSGSAGLFTVYNPSAANLNDIGSFLWQSSIIDQILQLFGNAYDAVISLHEIYVTPSTSGSSIINFGNIPAASVGAVPLVSSRYVTFTYPAMQVPGLNGNALDYQPYVGISIYLPFIGIQELNANDVMDGTISVTYVVDVVTGCCIAHLQITKYDSSQLLYSFEGNCAMQLPVTGREHVLKNELSNIGSLITLGATLYAGSGALNALSAGAGFALSAQGQNVQHKSTMSGNAGALSPRKPYLIINHKLPAMAEGYYEVIGGEANERALLSTCEGYTRVLDVHLEGINCTTSERNEIESLLKAGCIF